MVMVMVCQACSVAAIVMMETQRYDLAPTTNPMMESIRIVWVATSNLENVYAKPTRKTGLPKQKHNVLLLTVDALRYDTMKAHMPQMNAPRQHRLILPMHMPMGLQPIGAWPH